MKPDRIGLALGAGGARGLAHVHVLRALDDLGLRPGSIAGSSIGAIVGSCYASGMSGDEIRAYFLQKFGDRRAIIASIWALRALSLGDIASNGRPRLGEVDLERILTRLLPGTLPKRIEKLAIPMQVVATRYYRHEDAVFTKGPLLPALTASAAMPAVFKPVIIDGVVHIDGGMTNPVPFDLLQDKDFIIGCDVAGGPEGKEGKPPGKIDVLYAASQLMQRSIVNEKARRLRCDVLLQPPVGSWRVLDFMRTDDVLRATEPLYEDTKRQVEAALRAAHA